MNEYFKLFLILFSFIVLYKSSTKMSVENFYIHLNSDVTKVSSLQFSNTIGNFITRLNRRYQLQGNYEVALSRFHYTKSWYNIEEDQSLSLVEHGGLVHVIPEVFPKGNYLTVEDIVELLNEIYSDFVKNLKFDIFENAPKFEYNNFSNVIRIKLGAKKDGKGVDKLLYPFMGEFLANFLGLTDRNNRQYPFREDKAIRYKNKKIIQTTKQNYSLLDNTLFVRETVKQILSEEKNNNRSIEDDIKSDEIEKQVTVEIAKNSDTQDQVQSRNKTYDIQKKVGDKKKPEQKTNKSKTVVIETSNKRPKFTETETMQSDEQKDDTMEEIAFIYAFKQVSLHGYINNLNIYCDLLKPVSVGDVDAPLLRTVAVSSNDRFGEFIQYEPNTREYIPLLYPEFDTIEIDIKDDFNQTIDFKFGKVYLSLHFRKVNYGV